MLVTVEFLDEFENIPKHAKTSIDPEYNDPVENLKVLITLKYTELEVGGMEVYYEGKKLRNQSCLNTLGIREGAVLQVRRKNSGCFCF